jgi:hypothetical protein
MINQENAQEKTFGIEIETSIPQSLQISIGSHGRGLPIRSVTTSDGVVHVAPTFNGECWKADEDPSIRTQNGYKKCEFVSPILKGDAGIQNILAFLAFIKAIGGKRPIRQAGQTQGGIHVTLHAGNFIDSNSPAKIVDFCESVAKLGYRLSPVLFGQNAERRDLSGWCRVLSSREQDRAIRNSKADLRQSPSHTSSGALRVPFIDIGKYALINFTKIKTNGTFEFRSFSTTLNPTKVLVILTTCLAIAQQASKRKTSGWSEEQINSSELFRFFWSRSARRDVTNAYPTLKARAKVQFDWGFASCLHFDRLRSQNYEVPAIPTEGRNTDSAVALFNSPSFRTHIAGATRSN